MSAPGSLHDKASAVVPKLDSKPLTIVVAILWAGKDPDGPLNEDDFLWIKCHAKVSLRTIHQQYKNKKDNKIPWLLKHDGIAVDLESSVGDVNHFDNNVVVFEAVYTPLPTHKPAESQAPSHTGDPLSPKDPNPRLRPAPIPSSSPEPGNDNEYPPARAAGPKIPIPRHLRPPPGSGSTNSPKPPPSGTACSVPPKPLSRSPSFASQQKQPLASPAPQSPLVKVDLGNFPTYRDTSISHYQTQFRGESDEYLDRRLWANWLAMGESERALYVPSQQPALVKTEAATSATPTPPQEPPAVGTMSSSLAPATKVDNYGQKHFQLSTMLKDATPQLLESAVEASVKLLDTLKAPLADKMPNSPDAEHWIEQIDRLKKQAVKTKTVIGVVGNTGAGKSSVINAMLEEERLVPTNCMRACTACVTEISYNYEEQPYSAEIEFITAEDWAKELKVLFQDLLDGSGNVSRDCTNEDSDAGVAYAKIKAVYPQKTKEDISQSSIDRMLKEISHILGTKRNIKGTDSLKFYKQLQTFVDSKEKSTGQGQKQKREREFWPLIRVVRLYVKSPALATGAVIVDLPGVHDANAARAAVAEGYMKQCTGLWIVAPINRAVDDKAAKSLLGESFKRQLKMDGGFSAVTFICSKTDDISISEAQDSLGLDDKMVPSWEELDRLSTKQAALKKQLKELSDSKDIYEDVANDIDEQIEVWETLEASVNDGKVTYPPKAKAKANSAKKRKSSAQGGPSKKRRKVTSDEEDDADFIDDGSEGDEDASQHSDEETEHQEQLTEEQVSAKLNELKATKKDARVQKREITEKMQDLRSKVKEVQSAESKITSEMSALCISGRNQYSKGAIQQDFAAGIKEIDQEIAAEEDEDNFNPDDQVRDYDEVAKSLPVFCVSSRGYQKLQGRFRKDPPVPGFTTIEETEIPALQAHCEKLTETGRVANCQAFINKLSSLLNSLTIWASSDGTGANMTTEQKAKEARFLQTGMEGLETRLENVTHSCAKALNDELQDTIFDRYEAAVQAAKFDAVPTAEHWGAAVNRGDRAAGGLFWATYKAVCRRNGSFTNAQGLHDFNAQLTEPMIKIIAPGWEKAFTRRVQSVMTNFAKTIPAVLKKFHREIEDRARKIGTGLASLSMLSHQVAVYEQILKDAAAGTKDFILATQKEINREFQPVLERAMLPSYEWCTAESGPGQYKRMKAYMIGHVEGKLDSMFQESADEVKRQLQDMVNDVEEQLADKTDEVFIQIQRDYRSVLGGGDVPEGEVIPRVQRLVRKDIKRTIDGVERMMRIVVGLEVEDRQAAAGDEDELTKSESEDDSKFEVTKRENEDMEVSLPIGDVKHEPADHASPQLKPSEPTVGENDAEDIPAMDVKAEHISPAGSPASGEESSASRELAAVDASDSDNPSDGSGETDGGNTDEGDDQSEDPADDSGEGSDE